MSDQQARRRAFSLDAAGHAARSAVKAAWWAAAGGAARMITRPEDARPDDYHPQAAPAPRGYVRKAWMAAFEKDAADIAEGLYPAMGDRPGGLTGAVREAADFLADATVVDARRRRSGGVEARDDAPESSAYPTYYRQNFHYQSGGWFTEESARRYDAQVEALFSGTAAAMRRRALSLLARHWRMRDTRGVAILDLACGSGTFLRDLRLAFPRALAMGADLSPAYLAETARRAGGHGLLQANAERLPLANASLDAVTSIYLFHELPPRVRPVVAAEIARVIRPGGVFAFADSVQPADEPQLARLLEAFPAYFHEPYYGSYAETDLAALFGDAGLTLVAGDTAFLTKAMLFEKRA